MTVSMAGQEFVKQVYDGNKGLMVQGPQKQEMDQDMIAEIKQQMDLLAEMNYDKNGIISVLKGIDIIDGQSMYVIELKKANGSVVTEYYQVQTGLKFKSVSVSEEEGETVVAETIYKEYAKTGDIMFPSKMTQIAGPQTIDLSVDEMILNPKLDDKDFSIE